MVRSAAEVTPQEAEAHFASERGKKLILLLDIFFVRECSVFGSMYWLLWSDWRIEDLLVFLNQTFCRKLYSSVSGRLLLKLHYLRELSAGK